MKSVRKLYTKVAGVERKRRKVLERVRAMDEKELDRIIRKRAGLLGFAYSFLASKKGKRRRIELAVKEMSEEELDEAILGDPG